MDLLLALIRLALGEQTVSRTNSQTNLFLHSIVFFSAHMLLKGNDKKKVDNGAPKDSLPRLVLWSGRTEEAVNHILDNLAYKPMDVELIGLIHSTQSETDSKNTYRGYGIFRHDVTESSVSLSATCVARDVMENTTKHPIVWVFTGAGCQWSTMGKCFLQIPIIRNAIEKCHKWLSSKGINLLEIITSSDPATFDSIVNSFVGIGAIQIGMVDALKELGIEPDYIIGHSVGEIVCAYADGCFTAEQTILFAYYRGLAFQENEMIDGAMAAVVMSAEELNSILPEDIDIGCFNSANSCTISGPAQSVKSFVEELKSRNIIAKEVKSSHVAAHSRYVKKAAFQFQSELVDLIPEPMERSRKWLSTSVPTSELDKEESKYSSAEYHSKNVANPVRFHETSIMLPPDSLTIEIGPHALLQSLLKQNLPNGVHIGLANRFQNSNVVHFLSALGK
jgi:fatty acid synthase